MMTPYQNSDTVSRRQDLLVCCLRSDWGGEMKVDWPFPGGRATEAEPAEISFEYSGNRHLETIERPVSSKTRIAVVDERALFMDCLARCLKIANDYEIMTFSNIEDYWSASTPFVASIVIFAMPRLFGPDGNGADNDRMHRLWKQTPTILLWNDESSENILSALDHGIRGILPTNVSFDIAVEAIRLVLAGGTFVPASVVIQTRNSAKIPQPYGGIFTGREVAIVDGLRKGKSNKRIAFDLCISESTVKVHLRNIMNKLRANNRTQVAMLTNGG